MNPVPVDLHPEATQEAAEARRWYCEIQQGLGEAFANELDRAVERISRAPHRWPKHKFGTRCIMLHRFPYLVIYRETESTIQIVAIAHSKRRPGYWKRRT